MHINITAAVLCSPISFYLTFTDVFLSIYTIHPYHVPNESPANTCPMEIHCSLKAASTGALSPLRAVNWAFAASKLHRRGPELKASAEIARMQCKGVVEKSEKWTPALYLTTLGYG